MFCVLVCAVAGLVYPEYSFVESSVFDRGLVTSDVSPGSIVRENGRVFHNVSENHYASKRKEVLAFVTPWNEDGYRLSLEFGGKFSAIVPAWFQLVKKENGYVIQGFDVVRVDWISEMRKQHPHVKILPRINFELPGQDIAFSEKRVASALKQEVKKLVETYKFDGVFLEAQSCFGDVRTMNGVLHVCKELKKGFPRSFKVFADVPSDDKFRYGPVSTGRGQIVKNLIETLDCVFISLYELPMERSLSPIRALSNLLGWAQGAGVVKKVMVGLPLFGFDFSSAGVKHVFAEDVISAINSHNCQLTWVDRLQEHALSFNDGHVDHVIYYATLKFLHDRYEQILKTQFAGFGFWELAQGMPYFFDLL